MGPRLGPITVALAALTNLTSSASALPFGVQIYSCTTPGVIAPAFDDGPGVYSADILDRMEVAGFKATWFINGENRGTIYDHNATLRRMVDMGHQIGSHTWSHANLSSLTPTAIRSEMTNLEDAMLDILGFFPYYMRPPLLSVNSQALHVLQELEYHVIIGDLNTKDWKYQTKETVGEAKRLFVEGLERGYSIVEAHDQELWTQGELIDYMIAVVRERGIQTVTVAECLGVPEPSQWYRTARLPYPLTRSELSCQTPFAKCDTADDSIPWERITPDLTCGNVKKGKWNGYICRMGQCCSRHGNCGITEDYCAVDRGCQEEFGICRG